MKFIKLGGSLITDKNQPHTPCLERLDRICSEIGRYQAENPQEKLVVGHGSGSFGHIPARQYSTRDGVKSTSDWEGFHQVWKEARALDLLVMDSLLEHGLKAVSFAPSSSITPSSSSILSWNLEPIRSAIGHGLTPVVYGDVVFDLALGGTILSTEELFCHLAQKLHPDRILLAGMEAGVWADYPTCTQLIKKITPLTFSEQKEMIRNSNAPDVTGGMLSKVESMLALVKEQPGLEVIIYSGMEPQSIYDSLCGVPVGTTITGT